MCLSQVKLLLDRFDEDGNGQLDVDEFVGFYAEAKAMYELVAFSVSSKPKYGVVIGLVCLCVSEQCNSENTD